MRSGALAAVGFLLLGCRIVEKGGHEEAGAVQVRVFYGTDRRPTGHSSPGRVYGADRGGISYGTCEVSVPRDHRMGKMEISWGLKDRDPSPATHVLVLSVSPLGADAFFGGLRGAAQGKPAFVFIHGYNVAFDDAVRRTAQMAYDMGFEGIPVTYSWASQGSAVDYLADERAVEKTVPRLRQFLADVAARSGASVVHLVAHSMGNRALLGALDGIGAAKFGEVVSAAPDVDADVYRETAGRIRGVAARLTLYASSNDRALLASKEVHRGPRAGDSGEGIVVAPGLESIDVSAADTSLLGHSYYGESASVVSDLGLLLRERRGAAQRPGLAVRSKGGQTYWVLKP
jgi:esterase/lipase superfamily enzyme